jgi:hypothetical protein
MKTKKFFLGLVAIGTLYFSACQKSLTFEDTPPSLIDSTANPDSNYLIRVYSYDTLYNDPLNPTVVSIDSNLSKYFYDSQKRLIKITLADPAFPSVDLFTSLNLFYNLNDSLPFRARTESSDTADYYLFYSANGRLLKDSVISKYIISSTPTHKLRVTNYSYSANAVYKNYTLTNYISPISNFVGKDTLITDGRGNVINASTYLKFAFQTDFSLSSKAINTYDNNPSQYNKLRGFKSFYNAFKNGSEGITYDFLGDNNVLTSKIYFYFNIGTPSPVLTDSLIRTDILTYKQNGYPGSIKGTSKNNLLTAYKSKANLFYRAL